MARSFRRIFILIYGLIFGFMGTSLAGAEPAENDPTPRYITYYFSDDSPLSSALDTPYTHIVLAFVTATVDENKTITLQTNPRLDPAWATVPALQENGKKVLVSFGGGIFQAADYAPLAGREEELATLLADFVLERGLDGIDIDYEASETFFSNLPAGVIDGRRFLIALTRALRLRLPAPQYLISHAPQPPYLDTNWHGGAYLDILKAVGEEIDWIVVQYYDNPDFDSLNDHHVVGRLHSPFPTSYRALTSTSGNLQWPASKIVVGKPVHKTNVNSGYSAPEEIIEEIIKPLLQTYGDQFGGLSGWQYDAHGNDHPAWNTIVGQALLDPPE